MSDSGRVGRAALAAAVVVATVAGWWLFRFLTDDAYIAFRYVSNWIEGRGLVWNAAPFAPVEGYTSFLWVVLLAAVWKLTGLVPPQTANVLSLLFGLGTLALVARLIDRFALPPRLGRYRTILLALVALGVVGNRTFLAWLSSGLETALFNFFLTAWVWVALTPREERRPRWPTWLALTATLTALTRPDGYLVVLATFFLLALDLTARRVDARGAALRLLTAFPLLVVPVHVIWRRAYYGEWLPNTYYAKVTGAWPSAGLRYAASFVLEYAVWIWLTLALVWLVRRRRLSRSAWIVVGALAAHAGYYTLIVGGDHFEYRVYSHLVPFLFASFVWLAARLDLRPAVAIGLTALFVVASWPLPWVHWDETRDLATRVETREMFRPIAARFPPGARTYAAAFDRLQAWLIERSIGTRHREHAVFHLWLTETLPNRQEGARIGPAGHPVLATPAVGVKGWVFPNVDVIDVLGLNDRVIARTPPAEQSPRKMAHARRPPEGYVACFRTNITLGLDPRVMDRSARVTVEERLLTDEEIVACETRFGAR